MGIQMRQQDECTEDGGDGAGFAGFAYVRDLAEEEAPERGCVALQAFGRRRMFRVNGDVQAAARQILAEVAAEESDDLGHEYGIRSASANVLVIERLNRPYGPRADYNDVGETQNPQFYGGPAPLGWMAVV